MCILSTENKVRNKQQEGGMTWLLRGEPPTEGHFIGASSRGMFLFLN